MSTVIVRRVNATPVRTSSETWDVICRLLAPDAKSAARAVLSRAHGVACSSIASEVPSANEIVVYGTGPRVRFYCLYDDDAIAGEDVSEGDLPEVPTEGDWRMSIPVTQEDFEWSARAIKDCAPHITVRKAGDGIEEKSENKAQGRAAMRLNLEGFLKP